MALNVTPEERRRIAALTASDRPLIVCDIDEVVLEFVAPFMAYLDSQGHELRTTSFRLAGNVFDKKTGQAAEKKAVSDFLENFFAEHDAWQKPTPGALDALGAIEAAHDADIVFLTAMPPRHHARRRALLDSHGFSHPMIATEDAKGDAVAGLIRERPARAVTFIDDLPPNHISVLQAVPDALSLHLMAYQPLRPHLPPMPQGVTSVEDWPAATRAIAEFLAKRGR
ncbi:hypothetical protein [Oricola sp.]|uniref:hypothetical protein n=1 Tax=Oricola sp. TaxID=1979950 RepID=UPI0025EBB2B8|nr:hypothetical protein [Oricola sp.]MCI5075810.1 hypothetical protein [Oricola sp.]